MLLQDGDSVVKTLAILKLLHFPNFLSALCLPTSQQEKATNEIKWLCQYFDKAYQNNLYFIVISHYHFYGMAARMQPKEPTRPRILNNTKWESIRNVDSLVNMAHVWMMTYCYLPTKKLLWDRLNIEQKFWMGIFKVWVAIKIRTHSNCTGRIDFKSYIGNLESCKDAFIYKGSAKIQTQVWWLVRAVLVKMAS